MKQMVKIPLSLAAAGALAASAYGYSVTVSADQWQIIGSASGLAVSSAITPYDSETGTDTCGNSPIISAWRYTNSGSSGAWEVRSCKYDTEDDLGYTLLGDTGSYEGIWIHGSSNPTIPLDIAEVGTDDLTMETQSGWNLLSVGSDGVVFSENVIYEIFNDTSNGVLVYRFNENNSQWEIYAPTPLEEDATYTEAITLTGNEGFWVRVNSAKDYKVLDPNAAVNDYDPSIHDDPLEASGLDVDIEDTPGNNLGLLLSFPTTTERFYYYDFDLGDTDVEDTADTLKLTTNSTITDVNKTSSTAASKGLMTYVREATEQVTASTYDTTYENDNNQKHKGIFWEIYNQVGKYAFIPSTIQDAASQVYSIVEDINHTLHDTATPVDGYGAYYYLNLVKNDPDNNNTTKYAGSYVSGSRTSPNAKWVVKYNDDADYVDIMDQAEQQVLTMAETIQYNIKSAEDLFNDGSTKAYELKSAADDLLTALETEVSSSSAGKIFWTVTQEAESNTTEKPQVVTIKFNPNLANVAQTTCTATGSTDGTADICEVMKITITGDSIGTYPDTYIYLHDRNSSYFGNELNDTLGYIDDTGTIQDGAIYPEVYVSSVQYATQVSGSSSNPQQGGDNNLTEVNITGIAGTGAFSIDIDFYNHDTSDVTTSGDISLGDDVNLSTPETYVAANTLTAQSGTFSLQGTFKAGDEINITMSDSDVNGSQYLKDGFESFPNLHGNLNTADVFEDSGGNVSYTVRDSDIGSGDETTQATLTAKIASLFADDANVTATASGSVVTITTTPSSSYDDNETLTTALYDFTATVNEIDYDTIIDRATIAQEIAESINDRFKTFLREEGNTIYSLKLAGDAAYDAFYAFITDTPTTEVTTYQDDYARLYWNVEGISASTATSASTTCSTSTANRIDTWRLPTLLEVISLYDTSTGEVNNVFTNASGTNVFSSTTNYILTGDMDASGNYYAIKLQDMTTTTVGATASMSATIQTTCVADYYNEGQSDYKFNDYYFYTDAQESVNRLYTSGNYVYDRVLGLRYMVFDAAGHPGAQGTTVYTTAYNQCDSQGDWKLVSADILRTLAMYDLHTQFNNMQSTAGLNSDGLFDGKFASGATYWTSTPSTTTDTDGDGTYDSYYIMEPAASLSYDNLFSTSGTVYADEAEATAAGASEYKILCYQPATTN